MYYLQSIERIIDSAPEGPWGIDMESPTVVFNTDWDPIAIATTPELAEYIGVSRKALERLTLVVHAMYDIARLRNDNELAEIIESTLEVKDDDNE